MSSFEGNRVPIEKLHNSISEWVDEEKCFNFFEKSFNEFDKKWKKDLRGNYWRNSIARKLLQVHERIKLTDTLQSDLSTESSVEKRFGYPSLITYLRLTCFDQLGQPQNWMTFDSWLKSKKKKEERNAIVFTIKEKDKVKFSEQMYLKYQKIYGVKNSFYRFLREVIPPNTRMKLLDKIRINIQNEYAQNITERFDTREVTDADKESYLYRIRNDYTHNTYAQGPIYGFKSKKGGEDWHTREKIYVKKESHWIDTKVDFEEFLREVVLIGISEIIKK